MTKDAVSGKGQELRRREPRDIREGHHARMRSREGSTHGYGYVKADVDPEKEKNLGMFSRRRTTMGKREQLKGAAQPA